MNLKNEKKRVLIPANQKYKNDLDKCNDQEKEFLKPFIESGNDLLIKLALRLLKQERGVTHASRPNKNRTD